MDIFTQKTFTVTLNFVHKSMNKFTPLVFHNFFQLSQTVHFYGTRQASRGDLLQTSKNAIQYGLRSMQYFGSKHGIPFQFTLDLPHQFPFSNLN